MRPTVLIVSSVAVLTLAGCGESPQLPGDEQQQTTETQAPETQQPAERPQSAGTEATTDAPDPVTSTVIGRDGAEIGSVVIERRPQGVRFDLHVEGLAPGMHAVHIHETGRCDAPDFTSAGGHYDPADAKHGMPDADTDMNDPDHHAGDMLNQTVDDNGMLDALIFNQSVTVTAGPNALLDEDGSALVIHAGADDYESQPAGAAGERVACAPITR